MEYALQNFAKTMTRPERFDYGNLTGLRVEENTAAAMIQVLSVRIRNNYIERQG